MNAPKLNHRESLRHQLVTAMAVSLGDKRAQIVFDTDLWPVLDASMKAGELLVHRNTGPVQKPVHEAITAWLEVVGWTVMRVKADEHTVSKAELLKLLYDLDENCQRALGEAKMVADKKFDTAPE